MDSSLLLGAAGAPVLEQVLHPCPSLVHQALRLRSFVPGEFADEDGDTATQFILADNPPNSRSRSASHSEPVPPVPLSDWESNFVVLSDDDDDYPTFSCDLCHQSALLNSVFLLSCPCLFCVPCLRAHAESVFVKKATQIGLKKDSFSDGPSVKEVAGTSKGSITIDDSAEQPLESISCPKPDCIGQFSLSSAQQLAPEAFRF